MAGEESPQSKASQLVKAFQCPQCGGQVQLRAAGQSLTVVCGSCHTLIDCADENYKIVAAASAKLIRQPLIQLGHRGKILGVAWEAIGFMNRCDGTGEYEWDEYLLFNPFHGYRFLSCENGQWTVYEMVKEKPGDYSAGCRTVAFRQEKYRLFTRGQAKIKAVWGEFYWRARVGETTSVTEFICPPHTVSREGYESESVWSQGTWLDPLQVKAAFKITAPMPSPRGVAPAQPNPHTASKSGVNKLTGIFLGVMALFQMLALGTARDEQAFSKSFVFHSQDNGKPVVTEKFTLSGGIANVVVISTADVANNWVELEYTLNNEDTGAKEVFLENVEYYAGSDSDGPWTEGSQSGSTTLDAVAGGNYTLTIEPTLAAGAMANVFVTVKRDVPVWSNFLLMLAALLIFPSVFWVRQYTFETKRWSDSDFSPYAKVTSDD